MHKSNSGLLTKSLHRAMKYDCRPVSRGRSISVKRSVRIGWLARISYLAVVLLIAGCVAPAPGVTARPTAEAAPFATLSAVQSLVQRVRGNNDTVSLKETDPPVPVQADDRVTVNENGRARLRFQDFLTVEIFRNSQLQVGEPQLDLNTTGLIRLKQVFGHTRLELEKEVAQRVEVDTDFATISPTRAGSRGHLVPRARRADVRRRDQRRGRGRGKRQGGHAPGRRGHLHLQGPAARPAHLRQLGRGAEVAGRIPQLPRCRRPGFARRIVPAGFLRRGDAGRRGCAGQSYRHVDRPCDRHGSPHDRHVAHRGSDRHRLPSRDGFPCAVGRERLPPPPRPRSSRAWCGSRAARTRWGWIRKLPTLITRPPGR